ncbi:7-carboxy-7-deazaguanine synthase QueE [Anabaena cylindrica FACHB-243]|uniref:7-carboxy-7-deazaguanine synthase n=1 Tax=Anabaena cylindrica (strain ATCC 27899 / PCC 7122) TaxID=272123 RepID=K9ZKW7_ANACC|nr:MULTISPECIES: 7-carboxy-7-deazaguanine synthase QueE [Anabaena]AFZ59419.1 Radical SAM domain protein [Anabaena cylindrica PCC 7122]MBD2417574.1 7-carboxy-7-deazaguanine synthase QueE [Anabaena cylindrica FACHB-243]MBY5283234.1 7-carboxy-7-deazaguanine synthase QueE [Anabaena sp. CCAP 1446/1C]MBY5307689.1 7-carboxy-7-deazaguanine synthase QueE [Anabaena sp. CCAP 1446/1C]MCM2405336.1 7-carboxy-7-deazaguanine synthase QueE [Anabaena sp. CCAP 1446/1C]
MIAKTIVKPTARLVEVFSAIQGEGLNVGTRQIFIRFGLCDLRCHFCDSAQTWDAPSVCKIERSPGLRDFEMHSNPVPLPILLQWVERQNLPSLHDSISLTGGEPLLHAPFLEQFLPEVRSLTNLPIYLETGGHRPEQLAMILPYLDSVGMDLKLPSVSGETHWTEHEKFLQLCFDANLEVFVKIIVSQRTDPGELKRSGMLVGGVHQDIPIFLQPVTPLADSEQFSQVPVLAPSPDQILEWQALMKQFVKQVRVIPQTHKMLKQM